MASDDPTVTTLRKLRRAGRLSGQEIDSDAARQLLRTPPSTELSMRSPLRMDGMDLVERRRSVAQFKTEETLADIVRTLESFCEAFQIALADTARVAKERAGLSLLQLFEDAVRERLPEALHKTGKGGNTNAFGPKPSLAARHLSTSRRPIDRGLDHRDHGSDIIIPDELRDAIGKDIVVIVEHELKDILSSMAADVQKVLGMVFQVKDRVSILEENMLQRQVDGNVMAEQIASLSTQVEQLQAELTLVKEQSLAKDQQMDVLREQLARRNEALDDTRVKFRKEVMRYKTRIYELQTEVDNLGRQKRGPAAGAGAGSAPAGNPSERKQSILPSTGSDTLDEEGQNEVFAATESAVKEATHRMQEDMRQLQLAHIKERKLLMQEMNMKIAERDQEIVKWRERARQIQAELDELREEGGS